ncbi:MAG: GNAT family N-acetyltransferase [Chloroflexi bacterium]|nr:GNAT family N-acetyltransferase [Chloroflexota bacterium]
MTCCSAGIEHGTFESLVDHWQLVLEDCAETTFFDSQIWQKTWWSEFGNDSELKLLMVRSDAGDVNMIAPLMVDGSVISFLGSTDLVDYHDFLSRDRLSPNCIQSVVSAVNEMLEIDTILLQSLPGNSPTITQFRDAAEQLGWQVEIEQEDVAPRLELPATWDEYVSSLRKKDRHELRRKLRRLEAAGDVKQVELTSPADIETSMDDFMRLHRMSTVDKKEFMTHEREQFFCKIAVELAREGSTRLCFLEVNGEREATSLSFVSGNVRYLYNSGYNPAQSNLSVGLLNHALAIKSSIEAGHRIFDFMRGNESYKYHLGGVDRQIFALSATRVSSGKTQAK